MMAPEVESAADKLIRGIDDAMSMATEMLESSFSTREQFKSQWDSVLTSYMMDIGRIDEEYEQMAAEQKRRKKAMLGTKDNEANHALNYHMASKAGSYYNDGSDIFILPSDDNDEFKLTELPDDGSEFSANTKQSSKSAKVHTEQMKFDSRSSLLDKMEGFRTEEKIMLQRLAEAITDDGMTSNLTLRERQDLEDDLDRCRARQTQEIVASINDYKPKLGKKPDKYSYANGNVYTISVEDILNEAAKNSAESRNCQSAKIPRTESKTITPNPKYRSTKKKPARGNKLLLNSTSRKAEQAVLEDSDHFLAIHELAIETPMTIRTQKEPTGHLGLKEVENESLEDKPEPTKPSLLKLVQCNTRPLNPLEIGRRNRVDEGRR